MCVSPLPAQRVNSPASLETLKPLTATELLLFYRCIKKQFLNADMISFSFGFLFISQACITYLDKAILRLYIHTDTVQVDTEILPSIHCTRRKRGKGREGKKEPGESIRILPLAALDWNPPNRYETSTWALLYSVCTDSLEAFLISLPNTIAFRQMEMGTCSCSCSILGRVSGAS